MIHFTADLHLNHPKIVKYCHRPFTDVKHMDSVIKANWNSRVSDGDTVYVLGDFMFVNSKKEGCELVAATLSELKGRKILIHGNHDSETVRTCPGWESTHDDLRTSIHGQYIHMYHYPAFSWDRAVHGSWMLHGHCHGGLRQYEMYNAIDWDTVKLTDVGVDAWGFRPVSFYELRDLMTTKTSHSKEIDWKNAVCSIPDAECIDGTVYWISARNSMLGVYRRKTQSFLILRNKLGYEFVDQEYHWDIVGINGMNMNGTAIALQRLERCPVKIEDDCSYSGENMFGYLKEAGERFSVDAYAELVWAVRSLAMSGTLRAYRSFEKEENARRFMSLLKLDIRKPEVISACAEWARVELTVGHAMRRLRHGIRVGKEFFDGYEPSVGEFNRRLADSGHLADAGASI